MAKSLRCSDTGIVCRAEVTGETEDEVLSAAAEHAREKHGVDITQSTTLTNFARSKIRDHGRAGDESRPTSRA